MLGFFWVEQMVLISTRMFFKCVSFLPLQRPLCDFLKVLLFVCGVFACVLGQKYQNEVLLMGTAGGEGLMKSAICSAF